MNPSLEETIYCDFITSSPTTGAAADADSLPTCEVFEDNTDTTVTTLTVTKRTGKTGNYRVPIPCTSANGFEAAKSYNVVASATVGGVAAKAIVATFQMRTRDTDDLSTYAGADTSGTTTLLTRIPSALTITSGAVNVNDKTGFSLSTAGIDAVWAKTMTELSAVPAVTASTLDALRWIFILARNKITQTSTAQAVRNDADSATIATSTVSDDGTTFVRGEFG